MKIRCCVKLLGLLFVVGTNAFLAQTAQSTNPPTQRQMGSRKNYVGLSNFAEVSPNLFRGGQPGADGLKALRKMGVSRSRNHCCKGRVSYLPESPFTPTSYILAVRSRI